MSFVVEAVGGFVGGLVAGFIGYIEGAVNGALFQGFGSIISVIATLGIIYAVISFFAGVFKAILAGAFFCIGIIVTGLALGDAVTILGGFISISGLFLSLFMGHSSD
jgi:hypothetical protein